MAQLSEADRQAVSDVAAGVSLRASFHQPRVPLDEVVAILGLGNYFQVACSKGGDIGRTVTQKLEENLSIQRRVKAARSVARPDPVGGILRRQHVVEFVGHMLGTAGSHGQSVSEITGAGMSTDPGFGQARTAVPMEKNSITWLPQA